MWAVILEFFENLKVKDILRCSVHFFLEEGREVLQQLRKTTLFQDVSECYVRHFN